MRSKTAVVSTMGAKSRSAEPACQGERRDEEDHTGGNRVMARRRSTLENEQEEQCAVEKRFSRGDRHL